VKGVIKEEPPISVDLRDILGPARGDFPDYNVSSIFDRSLDTPLLRASAW
jgi:hypothetical protein